MQNNLLFKIFLVIITALSFVLSMQAQNPQPSPTVSPTPATTEKKTDSTDESGVLSIESNLVVVPVSVTDKNGQPILNLNKQDFKLEEDGKNQTVEQVTTAEQVPLEIAILFDVSGSVDPLFEFEKKSAASFLRDVMKPEDRATIFLISEIPVLVQKRDTSENSAIKVQNIVADKKYTAFFDTVSVAAQYLRKSAPPRSRRVILAISDGEDTYSKITQDYNEVAYKELDRNINALNRDKIKEILDRHRNEAQVKAYSSVVRDLQDANAVFYSINPAGSSFQLNKISIRGQAGMQRFSDETGGTSFLPKKAEDLEAIFRQISAELRAQYLLQYYSDIDASTGKFIKLNVILPNRGGLRVRARQGYFAGKTQ